MPNKPKAIVLLSGGLDSTTCLAIAIEQGFEVYALSFRYGQRHDREIQSACAIARHMKTCEHRIANIDLAAFGGSALTDHHIAVPKHRSTEQITQQIPITYVPARNTIFLSFALAWAEVIGSDDIFIGVNAIDYSGYVDCRPEFIAAFENMANLAISAAVEHQRRIKIHTPLMNMSKAQIIAYGLKLGVDYSMTTTCYDPDHEGMACAQCDACILRLKGFAANQLQDPIQYHHLNLLDSALE